jgi:hypothetical protein
MTKVQWKIYQMNVNSEFINDDLEEKVFMYQPQGFQEALMMLVRNIRYVS